MSYCARCQQKTNCVYAEQNGRVPEAYYCRTCARIVWNNIDKEGHYERKGVYLESAPYGYNEQ